MRPEGPWQQRRGGFFVHSLISLSRPRPTKSALERFLFLLLPSDRLNKGNKKWRGSPSPCPPHYSGEKYIPGRARPALLSIFFLSIPSAPPVIFLFQGLSSGADAPHSGVPQNAQNSFGGLPLTEPLNRRGPWVFPPAGLPLLSGAQFITLQVSS